MWLARDLSLQRAVALKEPRAKGELSPEDWRRFVMEAQVTGQLEHSNIIPVYELVHEHESRDVFYTMRFVRGQTLSGDFGRLSRAAGAGHDDALELRKFLNAFVAICHALAYAHSRGVVHCDLKPANIMLGAFGEVIVLDWGLAKLVGAADGTQSQAVQISDDVRLDSTVVGAARGTPTYMSPEQAEGRPDRIDSRTDIYGLGAILFAILTNSHPHRPSKTENTDALLKRIIEQPTPKAHDVLPSVPRALEAVCAKAMARSRSERYATAQELAKDVERWLADQQVSVYRDPWTTRQLRWMRRHRSWTASIAVSLVVAMLAAATAAVGVEQARRREAAARVQADTARLEATPPVPPIPANRRYHADWRRRSAPVLSRRQAAADATAGRGCPVVCRIRPRAVRRSTIAVGIGSSVGAPGRGAAAAGRAGRRTGGPASGFGGVCSVVRSSDRFRGQVG